MVKQKFIGYNDEILYQSGDDHSESRQFESKFKNESKPNYSNHSKRSENAVLLLKSTLTFGKYKDYTIEYVLDNDPKWLKWAIEKVEFFHVSEEVRELVEDAIFNL